jgi:hypothetical protein
VVFIGTSPFDVRAAIDAVPTPSPVVSAWVPEAPDVPDLADLPAVPAEPPPAPVQAAGPDRSGVPAPRSAGVQLGFADGTVMTLADDDPRAIALRAAAARLTGTN